jgi:antirestriction protein
MSDRRIYVACLAAYNNGILHGTWIDTYLMDEDDLMKEVREKVLITSPCPNVTVACPDCDGENTEEQQLENAAETVGFDIHMARDKSWIVEKGIGSMNYVGPTRIDALRAFGKGEDVQLDLCERCKGTGKVPSSEEWAIHDHEGYPRGLISEYMPLSEIAKIEELLEEVGDDNVEAFMAWVNECQGSSIKDADADKFREAYRGQYDSERNFAEEWAVETGTISEDSPMFSYIDWDHYWSGCLQHDFYYSDGYVFDRNV